MNKRILIKLLVIVTAIVSIKCVVFAKENTNKYTDLENKAFDLGKNLSEIDIVEVSDDNEIDLSKVQERAEAIANYQNYDIEKSKNSIIDKTSKNQAIYLDALDCGVTVTILEVDEYINELKVNLHESVEYETFLAFLDGYGITEEKYWELSSDVYKRNLIIEKHKNNYINLQLNAIYREKNNFKISDDTYYIDLDNIEDIKNIVDGRVEDWTEQLIDKYQIIER